VTSSSTKDKDVRANLKYCSTAPSNLISLFFICCHDQSQRPIIKERVLVRAEQSQLGILKADLIWTG